MGLDRIYCLVRIDLKMSKGKIAAQVGHALLSMATNLKLSKHTEAILILGVKDTEYDEARKYLKKKGLRYYQVIDAGRTEVEPGTITCLCIEPLNQDEYINYLHRYKLL